MCPFKELLPMSRGLRYLQNKNLNKDFTKVTKQLNEVQVETLQLKEENTKLRQQLAQKDYQIQAKNWTRFREGTKSLLIGDATVQNIVQENLVRTDVKVNKKGTFSDIKSELVGRLEADKIITSWLLDHRTASLMFHSLTVSGMLKLP